jgi:hypothetical protein
MGIEEQLKEIKELINNTEQSKKEKKFKLPFGTKVGKSQAKKNWITIMKINENGHCTFLKKQIEEQTINEDGVPRLATNQYVMFYKNNPLIVLPSWSIEPFSPVQEFQKSIENGSNIKGYKIIMAKMIKDTVKPQSSMGGMWKWIIGIGLAAIIGYALISGGGK